MDAVEALALGLPGEADRVRPLVSATDSEFKSVCEDYRDTVEALDRFAQAGDPAKADDYRQLAAELLTNAAARLTREQP